MIRKAKPSDFEQVFELLEELWPDQKLSKKKSKVVFEKTRSTSLVVETQGKITGYSSFQTILETQVQEKVAILTTIIVTKAYRGKGIGTKLLKETMKEVKKQGGTELQFSSTFHRKKAHKFYEKLGFNKTAYWFWKVLQ